MNDFKTFGYIYIITNQLTGKVYVGQTTESVQRRWQKHKATARKLRRQNRPMGYFQKALLKYPSDVWHVHEQSVCSSKNVMDYAERFYIRLYNANHRDFGYNLTPGGGGTVGREPRCKKHITQEQLRDDIVSGLEATEIAKKHGCHRAVVGRKIKHFWGKTLLQVRKELTGESRTERTRKAIATTLSNPNHPAYGRKHTEESKRHQSDVKRQWWATRKAGI